MVVSLDPESLGGLRPKVVSPCPPPGPQVPRFPDCMLLCPQVVAVYNLTLQVADMSGDGLTATASAIITLEDVNDNAPGFTQDEVLPPCTALLAPAGDCPPFLRFLAGTRDFVEGWEVRSFAEGAQVRVVAREHINSTRSWEISPGGPLCGPWQQEGVFPAPLPCGREQLALPSQRQHTGCLAFS